MDIKAISWLCTQTKHFPEMVRFFEGISGHSPRIIHVGNVLFLLPNGDRLEVFLANKETLEFEFQPIAGFLVEHIQAARAEWEAEGIEFIGPIHSGAGGYAWTHFRAPDGHIYELNYNPSHPANQI
jgi:hypothetical protein